MKNNSLTSVLIIGVVLVAAYFIVQTVRESAAAATAPFQQVNQANQALQTQVSNLLNPTPTIIPDPVTYINEVRALARLETIQYSIEKVITGETGWLTPARDVQAFAEALCEAAHDRARRERFGDAGQRRIATHFSLERMATAYRRLLFEGT